VRTPRSAVIRLNVATESELKNELDLPIFIQNSNKLTVEFVKGILMLIYGDRPYAR
jgi:hypothetical protein